MVAFCSVITVPAYDCILPPPQTKATPTPLRPATPLSQATAMDTRWEVMGEGEGEEVERK